MKVSLIRLDLSPEQKVGKSSAKIPKIFYIDRRVIANFSDRGW